MCTHRQKQVMSSHNEGPEDTTAVSQAYQSSSTDGRGLWCHGCDILHNFFAFSQRFWNWLAIYCLPGMAITSFLLATVTKRNPRPMSAITG